MSLPVIEASYPNVVYFNEVDKGGHFAAWEEPDLFSKEMRAAFRSLRGSSANPPVFRATTLALSVAAQNGGGGGERDVGYGLELA